MTAPLVRQEDIPIPDWMRSHLRSHGPDGLVCVDGAGTVLGWNDAIVGMLHDGEGEPPWILKPLGSMLGWTDTGPQEALFDAAAESGSARAVLAVKPDEDAPGWDAELSAARASDPGEARCFFVYIRHAPEASAAPAPAPSTTGPDMRVRRDMMELQVQNRMLMGRAGGLILVIDPQWGTVLHANEYSEEYLRVPVAKARGQRIVELIEAVEGFASVGDPAIWTGGTDAKEMELTFPAPSGNAWVVHCVCSTISWHGKDALLWIGRDVTDRRSEGTVAVTTGVTLPSSVVTPVAESLRSPAGRIELLARNVVERPDRPWHEHRTDLEEIQMMGDEIRAASEDLLYLTRITDGTLDIRRTETTVGRILAGVLPRVQRIARAHESEILTVQVDEEAPLFTDARLLMRALRGFVGRALLQDGVTVTLTATQDGDCVRFMMIDSAPVNDASILEQVLQPEAIAKASSGEFTLPKIEHLPTMLSVHLFRALGGHVEVQSSPGVGTQVTLTLLS